MIQAKIQEKYSKLQFVTHNTEILEDEARLAFEMINRWGMVMAIPEGEDSAGRAMVRLATPDELVTRAFEVSHLAMKQAKIKKLIFKAPDIEKIYEDLEI